MNNMLIEFIKMFFSSMKEDDFRSGLKRYGIEEENIDKLWEQVKSIAGYNKVACDTRKEEDLISKS